MNPTTSPLSSSNQRSESRVAPPSQLFVVKRNGQAVPYDASKIAIAMTKAFLAVEGQQASGSTRVRGAVDSITHDITQRIQRRLPSGGSVDIEDIQDLVELGLMRHSFQKVARAYVIYRDARQQKRAHEQPVAPADGLQVVGADGQST